MFQKLKENREEAVEVPTGRRKGSIVVCRALAARRTGVLRACSPRSACTAAEWARLASGPRYGPRIHPSLPLNSDVEHPRRWTMEHPIGWQQMLARPVHLKFVILRMRNF